jgi:carboxypeptidase C (cathepsin A)
MVRQGGRAARALFAAMLLAAGQPSPAQRAEPVPVVGGPILGPVARPHGIMLRGELVPYRAIFREHPLTDGQGRVQATISATAYVRSDAAGTAQRPVFFFFNGGPGASSSPFHFGAFGPRIRSGDGGDFADNPDSLLDVADLVFADPVATGFSRIPPEGDGTPFWNPAGDAAAMLRLIRSWLEENGRTASPLYIGGQSYGGFRLATMMGDAEDLNLKGLLFVSPSFSASWATGAAEDYRDDVLRFPSYAAAAWHHGKVDRRGLSLEQFFAEADAFARTDYLLALHGGQLLSEAKRSDIAGRMESFIGIPAARIADADLRISPDAFVTALLADREMVIGRLDMRVTAPVRPPARSDRPAAANDPALGLGATNVIISEPIGRYMREHVGLDPGRPYVSLTLDVNFRWDWQAVSGDRRLHFNPLPNVARVMLERPQLGMMIAGGLYDLATPAAAQRHAVAHSGIPLERVRFVTLPAGHSPYEGAAERAQLGEALRAFIEQESR